MSLRDNLRRDTVSGLGVPEAEVIGKNSTAADAVALMRDRGVGCVVVTDNDEPVGVFTERDVLKKLLAAGKPLSTPLADVMTTPAEVVDQNCTIATIIGRMCTGGFRHMPVVDESNRVVGIVSIRRIVAYLVEHFPTEVFNLPPVPDQKQLSREGA